MADTTSYIDMLRKFGSDLGLPKLNVSSTNSWTDSRALRRFQQSTIASAYGLT